MIRHAAAVVVALCLSTSPLYAQSAQNSVTLTVTATSANVRKSPSVASPVVGTAPRGQALVVTREVGDWVKVAWPSAPDGAGYVRVDMGTLAHGGAVPTPVGAKAAVTPGATPAPAPIAARTAQVPVSRPSAPSQASPLYVAPTHTFGVGAVVGGSTMGFGASARKWSRGHLGLQLEVSRHTYDSVDLLSRATSTDIAPSVLFAMNDRVSDYLWLRPYVGVAAHIGHASRTDLIFTDATETANTVGARVFLGAETAFSSLPQFSLSADVGYYRLPEPFVGFEPGGLGFSISAHWYVK
jgi:Bacterial SH3 domain